VVRRCRPSQRSATKALIWLAYLTWWRMTTAARLLRTSNRPVRRIAEDVGYTSEFAFAKAFKRALGSTPGQYRHLDEVVTDEAVDW
jgi:AraC-like DNA-binding protein